MDLALEFGVDTSDLIYQYYQKYGFTDLCEDLRMVSFVETSPKLKKKLPISEDDLNVINAFSNKVDSVNNSAITFENNTRIFFLDIELDFIEFVTDSTVEVGLKEGEYEIVQDKFSSILKVYDSQKGLFYIEIHECDGT